MRRPTGWQRIKAGGGLAHALELPRRDGDFSSRLTFAADRPPLSEAVLCHALANYRGLDHGEMTLAGQPADWLVGRYLARERVSVTLVRWCGQGLVALATIRSDEYDDLIDEVTECVASLRAPA